MLILRTFLSYIELIQLSMLGISLADSTFLDGFDYGKNRWWWYKLKIYIISIKERRHSHGWWDIRGEKLPPPQPLKAGDCILLHHLETEFQIKCHQSTPEICLFPILPNLVSSCLVFSHNNLKICRITNLEIQRNILLSEHFELQQTSEQQYCAIN